MIREVIGEVRMDPGLVEGDSGIHPKAPGMKYKHYAPKAELILVNGAHEKVQQAINHLTREELNPGRMRG